MQPSAEIIAQYESWWEGRNTDPLIYYVWRGQGEVVRKYWKPWMLAQLDPGWALGQGLELTSETNDWRYVDEALDLVAACFGEAQFAGAGFPSFFFNLGAGSLAANITGYTKFYQNTIWFEPETPLPFDKIMAYPVDIRSRYADYAAGALRKATERLKDIAIVSQADLGGTMDILASFRRTEQLLYDVLDEAPGVIKEAILRIEAIWEKYYTEYDGIAAPVNNDLRSSWMPILSRKRYYPLQCDLGAMISPGMFREFVQPSLIRQCRFLDRAVFHLDGQEMIGHLEYICAVPGLNAIQYTPGDGHPGPHDPQWFPLYQRIIDLGKKIVLLGFPADEDALRELFRRFPREAFYLLIEGPDRATGERLLKV